MGTHRYPRTRRSPIEHDVGGYTRLGVRVSGYKRGSGKGTPRRSRMVGNPKEDSTSIGPHAFTFNFEYGPGDGESVIVFSDNYQDASDEAWEERKDTRVPISVEAIDPDIGAALKWMGKKAMAGYAYGKPKIMKATHLGAKYAIRGAKAGIRGGKSVARTGYGATKTAVKGSAKLLAFGAQSKLIENLLRLCYQEDIAKRTAARAALKSRYPSVYEMCDFSPGWY